MVIYGKRIKTLNPKTPHLNDYDYHLKYLLESEYAQTARKDIVHYTKRIYFKQKSLPVYPEGKERDLALKRIQSNQTCLQYAIEEYEEWLNEINNYIQENIGKFEFYSGYKTGERVYPPMSYEIIDQTVERLVAG